MNSTKQQFALVTGGTSGIGYELVKLLANDGYNLVIVARTESDLERVSKEIAQQYGVQVKTIAKDLFDFENAFEVYNQVVSQNIQIDILINDAGHGHYGKFTDTDLRMELSIIDLNISSLVVLTKLFLKDMVARGDGKILNVSSIASKAPGPWQSVYHGTKAFVQSFTEAIRSELKDSGVTITALLPGATDTDFFRKANMTESKLVQEGKLDSAVEVARDGYKALMSGDDMVISGFMNKVQVAMANVTPDALAAEKMRKQQEPVTEGK
ncbi:MAG TPA: SDR family oxidoreductase [Chryseosolibacter sp.]